MKTVERWIADSDEGLGTSTWLKYEKADREYVATLKCSMCKEYLVPSADRLQYCVGTTLGMRWG